MITLDSREVFCISCGSFELRFISDELLKELSGTREEKLLKCGRCHAFFSKEFVENNLAEFTDEAKRHDIIIERMNRNARYYPHLEHPENAKPSKRRHSTTEEKIQNKEKGLNEVLLRD